MDKYEIAKKIENFAPLELAESWDCSGWGVDSSVSEIEKVMLCLTVTDDIVKQAKGQNCQMIISHHPLFFVPLAWKDINIYSAHTNMDRAIGLEKSCNIGDFTRLVKLDKEIDIKDFANLLKKISPNLRYVNNSNKQKIKQIAFCAGSGSEFIQEAFEYGADALVTGDLKFHTALDSPIILFDLGHFESEIMVLDVFEKILNSSVCIIKAKEKSPFIQT